MYNDWFTIGGITIHGYGVMIAIGILMAYFTGEKLGKKHNLDTDQIDTIIFLVLIGGFACSKLVYCLTVFDQFVKDPLSVLGSGGWVVYGGIVGGLLTGWLYCKKKNLDFMAYFNVLAPCIALAQGFGRIGCFFAGCCYGIETHTVFDVHFPDGSLGPGSAIGALPTQLIMSAGDFLIFGILLKNLANEKTKDTTAALYLVLYSLGRFLIEFVRGDTARGFIGPLSTSQFIAVFTFLLGMYMIWRYQQKNEVL